VVVEPVHVRRAALVALTIDALLLAGLGERDHAALAGRQLLVRVESEHGRVPACPDPHPVRVRRADALREAPLELGKQRSEREPPGAQYLEHTLLLALTEQRTRERNLS